MALYYKVSLKLSLLEANQMSHDTYTCNDTTLTHFPKTLQNHRHSMCIPTKQSTNLPPAPLMSSLL